MAVREAVHFTAKEADPGRMFFLLHPKRRPITEAEILNWHADQEATRYMKLDEHRHLSLEEPAFEQQVSLVWNDARRNTTVEDAMQALADAGVATFAR